MHYFNIYFDNFNIKGAKITYFFLGYTLFLINPIGIFGQCAKYEPPDGNILLVVGQDLNATGKSIYGTGYSDDVQLGAVPPAGVTTYSSTSLAVGQGITSMIDYGAGPLYADLYTKTSYYNNTAIVVGLYMVNDLNNVTSGARDANLDALGNWIKSVSPRPVFLRIGYEFDYQYGCCSSQYIQAWQYIVNRFRTILNVTNVAFVWQASSGSGGQSYLLQWYPGDSYVDWMAYSHFFYNSGTLSQSLLDLARLKRKPVMIAESTPQGYYLNTSSGALNAWTNYFAPLFTHLNTNLDIIKAFCYINQDWDAQSQWAGQGWGDSKIQDNGDGQIKTNWLTATNQSYFVHGTSTLFNMLINNTPQPFFGTSATIPGIIQAEDFDVGCEGSSYYDSSPRNFGSSNYRYGYSVDLGPTADASGNADIAWIATGEWLDYTVNVATSGQYNFMFRVSSPNNGNTFHIEQNGVNVSGAVVVPSTGSWGTYTNMLVNNINLNSGINVLRIYFDNIPGSGFNLNYFSTSSPLPVDFLNFTVKRTDKNDLQLQWTTASAFNNKLFEIERSYQSTDFFDKIGEVASIGNSSSGSIYTFIDKPDKEGVYYYRIRQIDLNGLYSYSEVLSVVFVNQALIRVFPNPFVNEVVVQINGIQTSAKIVVMDLVGKIVYQGVFSDYESTIGSFLNPGIYIITIEYSDEIKIIHVEKINH